jgi:hypothetical protein
MVYLRLLDASTTLLRTHVSALLKFSVFRSRARSLRTVGRVRERRSVGMMIGLMRMVLSLLSWIRSLMGSSLLRFEVLYLALGDGKLKSYDFVSKNGSP